MKASSQRTKCVWTKREKGNTVPVTNEFIFSWQQQRRGTTSSAPLISLSTLFFYSPSAPPGVINSKDFWGILRKNYGRLHPEGGLAHFPRIPDIWKAFIDRKQTLFQAAFIDWFRMALTYVMPCTSHLRSLLFIPSFPLYVPENLSDNRVRLILATRFLRSFTAITKCLLEYSYFSVFQARQMIAASDSFNHLLRKFQVYWSVNSILVYTLVRETKRHGRVSRARIDIASFSHANCLPLDTALVLLTPRPGTLQNWPFPQGPQALQYNQLKALMDLSKKASVPTSEPSYHPSFHHPIPFDEYKQEMSWIHSHQYNHLNQSIQVYIFNIVPYIENWRGTSKNETHEVACPISAKQPVIQSDGMVDINPHHYWFLLERSNSAARFNKKPVFS